MNREALPTSNQPLMSATAIPTIPVGTTYHRLENGLEIIVREDRSAPVVSAQAWCRAGSIDEGAWMGAGLSHVLEHMLFKGTSTRGAGRIDQEVQAAGGYMNAYTSFDRTVYWISVPNTGATVAIDILCDIFQNATLPAEELVKELDVIRREMAMGNDDPSRRASRGLFETAYKVSPYRYPIIGLPDIFNRVTREDLVSYYTQKYAPNNCFFVVVGDIRPEAAVAQIREAFAKSGARSIPLHAIASEPKQTAPREALEEAPVELGHFHFAWHIPDLRHPETPILDVLAALLGSGRSSRLYRAVREKAGLVHSVNAWIYTPGATGIFGVSGVADGDKVAAAKDEILAEIERLKQDLISSAELAKAVKQFTVATLSAKKTMDGQAQDLGGNWMTAHDLSFSERYLAAVRLITPEDIRRVANQYLTLTNQTSFALLPSGTTPKTVATQTGTETLPVIKYTLPNGLRLLVKEDHRLPFVQFRAAFQGGLLSETVTNSGVTSLMAKLLVKGTARRTAEQLADEIESLGGSLDPYAGNHSFGLSTEVLNSDFATGLDLFLDPILNPSFPEVALERERIAQLAAIRAQRDQLLQCAFKAMRRGMFGDNTYGLDALGSDTTVRGFKSSDLRNYHQRLTVPNNAVIAIFGDVHPEAVRGAVEAATQGWKPGLIPTRQGTQPYTKTPRSEESREKEQAVLALGFPGATIDGPDRFALDLIQEACSDMGSRLFMRIRDELGLAYYVGATHFAGIVPGYFAFYCGTAPEKATLVEEELRKQAELLAREGLTEEELSRAKAKLIGQRKIGRQDLGSLAMTCTLDELYGMGHDRHELDDARYESITLEEIRTVAAKYLVADRAVVAVVKGT
ncbi:MAG TPA: pitrilysin family protein [Candidatus Limnocylindria bacterium]|nr:pitrilysin family protein [Candidatus Limnocylindria bacterium]